MHPIGPVRSKAAGLLLAVALATSPGCGDNKEPAPAPRVTAPAPAHESAENALAAEKPSDHGVSGRHRAQAGSKWVPGEYKVGRKKWRDAGVYVDGEPVGIMWFGELPFTLEPVWLDDVAMLEFKAGDKGPREKPIKVRRYRLAEYLEGLGVDLAKVKEIQIYGGKGFPAVIKGKELRRVRDTLYFTFGRETSGKPLILFPEGLETNTSFDHISAITVYIDKRPPRLRDDGELELDGKPVYTIPYFGEPLRGGIRVYKDGRLVTVIKRRKLEGAKQLAVTTEAGMQWKLLSYLESRGVKTDEIVAAEIILNEKRVGRLERQELANLVFTANPQASGKILLGRDQTPAQALALYTAPLPDKK